MGIVASLLVFLALLAPFRTAVAETVALPLSIDHALLGNLVAKQAFTAEGESAVLFGGPQQCNFVRLAQPRFSGVRDGLRLLMKLSIRTGTPVGNSCFLPLEWEGYVELVQRPQLDPSSFVLSFLTIDSALYDLNLRPAQIAGVLWDLAKPVVHSYLDSIRINLAPPVRELRNFLFASFIALPQPEVQKILDSLRSGPVTVDQNGVRIQLLAEVQQIYREPESVAPLSGVERQQVIKLWETWDAFLVQLLLLMAKDSLSQEEQLLLSDVLLDTRYRFSEQLAANQLGNDLVREQFLVVWRQLAPIFRRQLYGQPSANILGYLAFFTAADALDVFDRLGPTFGIEISQQGLVQMAAMLSGRKVQLLYQQGIDARLRKLLELPPEPTMRLPEKTPPLPKNGRGPLSQLSEFFLPVAAAGPLPTFADILQWRPPRDNVSEFVRAVRSVLRRGADTVLGGDQVPASLQPMYRSLVDATAWQESCFRQFVVKENTLTYLLSYNGSSVGVMQVNERVWRGMYRRDQLRWDIDYNGYAGCEILALYLHRYVLASGRSAKLSPNTLARVLYAMYNGGPGQYKKFLEREKQGRFYQSDQLFEEKLQWVKQNDWRQVEKCLIGG